MQPCRLERAPRFLVTKLIRRPAAFHGLNRLSLCAPRGFQTLHGGAFRFGPPLANLLQPHFGGSKSPARAFATSSTDYYGILGTSKTATEKGNSSPLLYAHAIENI
jgi:hypothetical protein